MSNKKSILSAIQPTGSMHFGNYFGAIENWVKLQEEYECFYGVVDYHAMTMPYNPKKLREATWNMLYNLVGVGVKPENLFIQSLIPEHAELCWILNNFTSYGQLSRMTQFKDKSSDSSSISGSDGFISAGLLDYPVLQAADILIYRADYVPVGKDQEQHLELTRSIAQRFNNQTGKEYFQIPETLYTNLPKVLSTADPKRKMSKSLGAKHYIDVFEDEKRIRKQIRSAVTDAGDTPVGKMSAGVRNLFELLKATSGEDAVKPFMKDYKDGGLRYSDLKDSVADGLVTLSNKFRNNKKEIMDNKREFKEKIRESSSIIRNRAKETLKEVKDLAGLNNPR